MTREFSIDYFHARYYNPLLGRPDAFTDTGWSVFSRSDQFMSPDPGNAGAIAGNPQSWDAYSYVLSNPETLVDPTGLCDGSGDFPDLPCPDVTSVTVKPNGAPFGPDNPLWWYYGSLMYPPAVNSPAPAIRSGPPPKPSPQTQGQKKGFFACTSDAAESVSIAADLHHIPGLKSGVGGFIANALGGNPFSGLTDLLASFNTGEAGGHNVFYNMALADAAGPAQGFGPLFGKAIEGTPWAAGPTDVAMVGLLGEYATGVGESNLAFSTITYGLSMAGCGLGVVH